MANNNTGSVTVPALLHRGNRAHEGSGISVISPWCKTSPSLTVQAGPELGLSLLSCLSLHMDSTAEVVSFLCQKTHLSFKTITWGQEENSPPGKRLPASLIGCWPHSSGHGLHQGDKD